MTSRSQMRKLRHRERRSPLGEQLGKEPVFLVLGKIARARRPPSPPPNAATTWGHSTWSCCSRTLEGKRVRRIWGEDWNPKTELGGELTVLSPLVLRPLALDPGVVVGTHGRSGPLELLLLGYRTEQGLVGGGESPRGSSKERSPGKQLH